MTAAAERMAERNRAFRLETGDERVATRRRLAAKYRRMADDLDEAADHEAAELAELRGTTLPPCSNCGGDPLTSPPCIDPADHDAMQHDDCAPCGTAWS